MWKFKTISFPLEHLVFDGALGLVILALKNVPSPFMTAEDSSCGNTKSGIVICLCFVH